MVILHSNCEVPTWLMMMRLRAEKLNQVTITEVKYIKHRLDLLAIIMFLRLGLRD